MVINKVFRLCVVVIFVSTTFACSYNKNKEESHIIESESIETKKISSADRKLIDEYNQIVNTYLMEDENKLQENLRLFIPKALQIENNKEKNNILMNIYMQTKQYKDAYNLNEQLINQNNAVSRVAFRCQLLELLNKDENTKKQCYEISATLIKENLTTISKNDPVYSYAEFLYFLEMYRAGHNEYKDKMKIALSLIKDQSLKMNANIWYEDAISNGAK